MGNKLTLVFGEAEKLAEDWCWGADDTTRSAEYYAFLAGYEAAMPSFIDSQKELPDHNELVVVTGPDLAPITAYFDRVNRRWIYDSVSNAFEKVRFWTRLPPAREKK